MKIDIFIEKEKEGLYFELPFDVPENVDKIDISYSYKRRISFLDENNNEYTEERNIIDLALNDNEGEHVGSSGSDRDHIFVSEYYSSLGYDTRKIKPGKWSIIVGAYRIYEEGVTVSYEISFTYKELKLYKGDMHLHTLGSDGKLSIDEIVHDSIKIGLDYIFITDHNNYVHNNSIICNEKITIMPGVEWTHFKGHANMLGVKKPYDGSFYANTLEKVQEKFLKAKEKGAIVVINHPFCNFCSFKFGIDNVEYHAIEVWNNVMKESEMKAIYWWRAKLNEGKRIPIVGGSDFHKFELAGGIGIPCTCLYSMSRSPSDIYEAILKGHGFITYDVNGPGVLLSCEKFINGDVVLGGEDFEVFIEFTNIKSKDLIKLTTNIGDEEIEIEHDYSNLKLNRKVKGILYFGAEVYRKIVPVQGFPPMLSMISNPLYFK